VFHVKPLAPAKVAAGGGMTYGHFD
jgi:hypothetical protein